MTFKSRKKRGRNHFVTLEKPIPVVSRNAERIEAKLLEVNGRAEKYVFRFYDDILKVAKRAEREFDKLGFPPKERRRAYLEATSGKSFTYYEPTVAGKKVPINAIVRNTVQLFRMSSYWTLEKISKVQSTTQITDEQRFSLFVDCHQALKGSLASLQKRNVYFKEDNQWVITPAGKPLKEYASEFVFGSTEANFPLWAQNESGVCLLPTGEKMTVESFLEILGDEEKAKEYNLNEDQRETLRLCLKWHNIVRK